MSETDVGFFFFKPLVATQNPMDGNSPTDTAARPLFLNLSVNYLAFSVENP